MVKLSLSEIKNKITTDNLSLLVTNNKIRAIEGKFLILNNNTVIQFTHKISMYKYNTYVQVFEPIKVIDNYVISGVHVDYNQITLLLNDNVKCICKSQVREVNYKVIKKGIDINDNT